MSITPIGILFYDATARPLSNAGQYQAGAYYQFYLTGTTTPANVYLDGALTVVANQTPGTGNTTANGVGKFVQLYLNPSTIYRVQLYNSAGQLQSDTDPYVVSSLTQEGIGVVLYPITAAEIAAGVTPVNYYIPPLWVDRYGTNTTPGTTPMTAAVQNAIAVANASGIATVLFNPVTYVVSTPLTHARGVTLACPYGGQATIDFSQIAVSSGSPKAAITITTNNAGAGVIPLWRNMRFSGNRAALTNPPTYTQYLTGVAIGVNLASAENVQISGFQYGETYLNNSYILDFYNFDVSYNQYGVYFNSVASTMGERISHHGGLISNNYYGIYNNLADLVFNNMSIDQNVTAHVLDNITAVGGAHGEFMEFNHCHIENESAISPQGNVRFTNHGLMRFNGGSILDQVSSMFVNATPAVLSLDNDVLYAVSESLGYSLSGNGAVRAIRVISGAANTNWRLSALQSGIGNSNFETGSLSPWAITTGTNAAIDNTNPHSGTYCLKLAPTSGSVGTVVTSPKILIGPTFNQVALSFWGVNKNTSQQMTAQIVAYDVAGNQLNNQPLALATGQSTYSLNQTTTGAPPGGGYAVVEFTFPAGTDTTNMCYIDDVYINVQ